MSLLNASPWLKAGALAAQDEYRGLLMRLGRIDTDSGTIHSALDVSASLDYIQSVFEDYVRYGRIDAFRGRAAELGPGDNAGVALLLRAAGCDHVDLVDRYYSRRDPHQQKKIYEALSRAHRLENMRPAAGWDDRDIDGVQWQTGVPAERYFEAASRDPRSRYSLIVSRAVMEHLFDPLCALRYMALCLEPGGRLVHKVDLRDHGMFTPHHDELTYLTLPAGLHRRMTRHSGRPNRVLVHRYRDVLDALRTEIGLSYEILVTRLVGGADVIPHVPFERIEAPLQERAMAQVDRMRPRLAAELREVPATDLAVAGFFLVAQRAT